MKKAILYFNIIISTNFLLILMIIWEKFNLRIIKALSYLLPKYSHYDEKRKALISYIINNDLVLKRTFGYLKVINNNSQKKMPKFEITLRANESDFLNFEQIFGKTAEYQALVDMVEHRPKILNILDCGAYIGLTSIFFANAFPNSKIIALEPYKENFEVLSKNKSKNNRLLKNLVLLNKAVWSKNTFLTPEHSFRDGNDWSFRVQESIHDNHIPTITLSEIIANYDLSCIDILKMDIEGAEFDIFKNDTQLAKVLEITRFVTIEVHQDIGSLESITSVLEKYNFTFTFSGEILIAQNREYEAKS